MKMEGSLSEPVTTMSMLQIEHVTLVSDANFEHAKTALEAAVPIFDASVLVLLRYGANDRAKDELEKGPPLAIFLARDHGALLQIAGLSRKAIQYEIGNPLTASKMTRHHLGAALYAPLRVLLYEDADGHAVFEYDRPVTLFGQFYDSEIAAVAAELDRTLEEVLRQAAS
jgi:uncharacterized protein (DUF302 family)